MARRKASTDSDLDLMVTFFSGVEPGLNFLGTQDELERITGRRVDLFTRRSVELSENYVRRRSILESAREIYAA
jgi:predicted nucleotidyltransferase